MEARIIRAAMSVVTAFCLFVVQNPLAEAAGYRTANFTVDAPTARLAKEIGDAAEQCRTQLSQEWLGKPLPNWSKPCPIKAQVAPNLGAGGATSFVFDRGEVFDWRMEIQGSRERILDSVVPHEVTHTIFASHFRQPIPRWADEGACTTVEHRSEIAKQEHMLIEYLQSQRGIPFSNMFAMKEYPQDVLPLYAQGHSLARFLIDQRGKREFLAFIGDGLAGEDWIGAVRERYGYRNLLTLQNSWQSWVVQGRPQLQLASNANTGEVLIASHESSVIPPARLASTQVIRGQDPGTITPTPAPVPQSFTSAGINGPLGSHPHGNTVSREPWIAVGSVAATSSAASVYDARATGRVLR